MPQLNFADFAPQVFWLVITFGLLYLLMAKVALPKVAGLFQTREDRIAHDLDAAERLNQEAQDALHAYEATLSDSRNKAIEMTQKTRAEVQAITEAKQAEAEQRLSVRAAEAEAQIAEALGEAMKGVREIAAETANDLVTRLVGTGPDSNTLSAAIDTQLRDRGIDQ